jgi:hypothetical protein
MAWLSRLREYIGQAAALERVFFPVSNSFGD